MLATCAGVRALPAGEIRYFTYNALDFLTGNYWEGDSAAQKALVSSLCGFARRSEQHDVISLDTVKERLWDRDLSPQEAAIHFGDLDNHAQMIDEARRKQRVEDERMDSKPHYVLERLRGNEDTEDIVASMEQAWQQERQQAIKHYQGAVNRWGSLELIDFVRAVRVVAIDRGTLARADRAMAVTHPHWPRDMQSLTQLRSRWPGLVVNDGLLELESEADAYYRILTFSQQCLAKGWLADHSHANLDGQVVPFQKGDEILFSVEEILRDLRCGGSKDDIPCSGSETIHALEGKVAEEEPDTGSTFIFEGAAWKLTFGGRTVQVADRLGLHYIAALLRSPYQRTPAETLQAMVSVESNWRQTEADDEAESDAAPIDLGKDPSVRPVGGRSQSDTIIDERTRADYKERLGTLDKLIKATESRDDLGEAERLDKERSEVEQQLKAATGLGGRPRRFSDDASRTAQAVGRAIRYALKRLDSVHPGLANHLKSSIEMGAVLRYAPEQPVSWTT